MALDFIWKFNLLKMVIFHSYVSLPEGSSRNHMWPKFERKHRCKTQRRNTPEAYSGGAGNRRKPGILSTESRT
jgi:hypothetical protein